jgi:hypothetical protein
VTLVDRDPFSFDEGLLRCDVDTAVYRVAAAQKAAYKLAALSTIHIAERGPEKLALTFMFAEPKGEEAARSVGRRSSRSFSTRSSARPCERRRSRSGC